MKRVFFTIITAIFATLLCTAQYPWPKHEVRAVWLTTIGGLDWPHSYAQTPQAAERQKEQLTTILDQLQKANVNTVLLQTRVRATTIYASAIEPWDGCLSGKPGTSPGYDALQFAVDECHRRGMELHAWVVTIPVGKWNALGCTQLRKKHPQLLIKIGDEGYMDPESEQTADYLANICREIVSNYDVDGIHLDYIRYPETWKKKLNRNNGRNNITRIVNRISTTVKTLKPWVKMSCSPIGKYDDLARYNSRGWNANTTVCQDAQRWLREGTMDMLFPMIYFRDNHFFPFAIDWAENSHGRIIAPGLAIYMLHPREQNWPLGQVERQLNVCRQYGMGHTYFRSRFLTDDVKGIYGFVANQFDRYPALVPPMTWQSSTPPPTPLHLYVDGDRVCWQPPVANNADQGASTFFYNVYTSTSYPVDTDDARNLTVARWQTTSVRIPQLDSRRRYVAVTATDRYGNESKPLQMAISSIPHATSTIIQNNGTTMLLPALPPTLDPRAIIISSMAGNIIAAMPYSKHNTDISKISNGVYIVKVVSRKNASHRLGTLIVRR